MCASAELTVHWKRKPDLAAVVAVIETYYLRSSCAEEGDRVCYTDVLPGEACWCSPEAHAHTRLQDALNAVAALEGVEAIAFLWDFQADDPHTSFLTDARQLPDVQAFGPTYFLHNDGSEVSAIDWYVKQFADGQDAAATLQALDTNYMPATAAWVRGMRREAREEAAKLTEQVVVLEAALEVAKSHQLLSLPGLDTATTEEDAP